ncbi:MAG: sugar phosphate isomerase/epimerase, partial [Victivallales bacterium]|nr:sugar phosphate isomerase/epimerase [Victivallales bacterium]
MKYSFMSFSCPELDLDGMLRIAAEYGYQGVEPRVESKHGHGLELDATAAFRAEAKAKAAASGIAFSCLATSCRYADPATCQEHVDDTIGYIDLASDIGAPALRVFGGTIPAGIEREAAIKAVTAALKQVADHAAARDVKVCFETHDHWCLPEHVAEVMRRVDHPAIRVNWDIMHPVRVEQVAMADAYATLKPWISHCHFHDGATTDGKLAMVPIGEGIIDHETALKLLEADRFAG